MYSVLFFTISTAESLKNQYMETLLKLIIKFIPFFYDFIILCNVLYCTFLTFRLTFYFSEARKRQLAAKQSRRETVPVKGLTCLNLLKRCMLIFLHYFKQTCVSISVQTENSFSGIPFTCVSHVESIRKGPGRFFYLS